MIGQRLKMLRENLGKLQSEMADELKISRVTYNRYEKEERAPDFETLKKMAKHLKVSTDYLIGATDDKRRIEDIFSPSIEEVRKHAETMNLSDEEKMALGILKGLPLSKQQSLLKETISDFNDLPDEEKKTVIKMISAYLSTR